MDVAKTRIALIRLDSDPEKLKESLPRHIELPLDLEYIRIQLQEFSHIETSLIDQFKRPQKVTDLFNELIHAKISIVVLKGQSFCKEETLTLGRLLRSVGVTTIVTGQLVAHHLNDTISSWKESFDIALYGEPELEVPSLIGKILSFPLDIIKSEYEGYLKTRKPFLIEQPDKLPLLSKGHSHLQDYIFPYPFAKGLSQRFGYILTAWGCPYTCHHCTDIVRKTVSTKYRKRSPSHIADEIQGYLEKGYDSISFEDDTLFCDKNHLKALIKECLERKLHFKWVAFGRPDEITEELASSMRQVGPGIVRLGVESGSPRIIESLNKAKRGEVWVKKVREAHRILKNHDIDQAALIMIGSPGETEEDIAATHTLMKEINPTYLMVHIFEAYPEVGFNKGKPLLGKSLSKERLIKIQKEINSNFYFRVPYLWSHLRQYWRYYLSFSSLSRAFKIFKSLLSSQNPKDQYL